MALEKRSCVVVRMGAPMVEFTVIRSVTTDVADTDVADKDVADTVFVETESMSNAFVQFCRPSAPVVKTLPAATGAPAESYVRVYWRERMLKSTEDMNDLLALFKKKCAKSPKRFKMNIATGSKGQ
jgi:hypothetical protein